MSESEAPQRPPDERRAEIEAMLEAVEREVLVIHSSKDECEQLWEALRPDLWEQAGPLWSEYEALYNTAQVVRVRRVLDQPGGSFTLAKLYELIEKHADLYTRSEYVAGWDMPGIGRETARQVANETYDQFASREDPDVLDLPKLRRVLAPRHRARKRVEVPPEERVAYEASGAQRFDDFANRRVAHNVDRSQPDYTRNEFESLIAVLEERLKYATLLVTRAGLVSATPGGLDDFVAPLWAVSPALTPRERRFYWTENEALFAEARLDQASEEDRPAAEAELERARAEHQAASDALYGDAAQLGARLDAGFERRTRRH